MMEAVKIPFKDFKSDDPKRQVNGKEIPLIIHETTVKDDNVIQVITNAIKQIIDSLDYKVVYELSHDEIYRNCGVLKITDKKTHDTVELKLTVKIPV
jgi:hypothetical protein